MSPNGEGGPTQYDPDQHQRQWDVQSDRDHGEGRRKGRKENHDGDDEPHVVGLPNRTDRLIDERPLRLPLTAHCKKRPDAGPEVRSAE